MYRNHSHFYLFSASLFPIKTHEMLSKTNYSEDTPQTPSSTPPWCEYAPPRAKTWLRSCSTILYKSVI